MCDKTNFAILTYLPWLPPWEKIRKNTQPDNTKSQNLPTSLLDFFMLSQKPFQAGAFAKFSF